MTKPGDGCSSRELPFSPISANGSVTLLQSASMNWKAPLPTPEPRSVFLAVQDHGIGIPAEHLPRIFDMFYRVSGGLVQTSRGSGVGLAIVRHIMNAHGGTVEVVSTPGAGSTFTLRFPVKGTGTV